MASQQEFQRIPLTEIKVLREERQRKVIDVSNLVDSVSKRGVLNPIIITKDNVLVAGERRFEASKAAGLFDIPCRYLEDLDPIEAQIIELEENVKRSDLDWRDLVTAYSAIHDLYSLQPDWSQSKTADALGLGTGLLSSILRVARDIDNPRISEATSYRVAYNILSRVDQRATGDALSDIINATVTFGDELSDPPKREEGNEAPESEDQTEGSPKPAKDTYAPARAAASSPTEPSPDPILNVNFLEWTEAYTGQPFNFIHCDFPYGVNYNAGKMSGSQRWEQYSDSPDVYWTLLGCLCKNLDKLMSPSAHLMFWFSMEHYHETLEFFATHAPSLQVQKFPLIWTKSDNVGILPDPKRGPRRIYETCLIASREDRYILRSVSNSYSAPTDKTNHNSAKNIAMLKSFMSMFVDENTRMLDPTCGSGNALHAADQLGAKQVLGLEISPEHYTNALRSFKQAQALRRLSK